MTDATRARAAANAYRAIQDWFDDRDDRELADPITILRDFAAAVEAEVEKGKRVPCPGTWRCQGCGAYLDKADLDGMNGHAVQRSEEGGAEQCGPCDHDQDCPYGCIDGTISEGLAGEFDMIHALRNEGFLSGTNRRGESLEQSATRRERERQQKGTEGGTET